MEIRPGDLDDRRIIALLDVHVTTALAHTAPRSGHALDHAALKAPDIRFFAAWQGDALLGVGAIRDLGGGLGEVKSMHVAQDGRRRGTGAAILRHLVGVACEQGMTRLSLETGSWDYFRPAHALYRRHDFMECAPFGDYRTDPNSLFFTRALPIDPA